MKTLDRYIVRELIKPIVGCCLTLISLILIADLFNNLDEFLRFKAPSSVIFKYYLSLIPYSFIQTIPWASWLGTLFLLITFSLHNEIIAMKAAGLKITSIIRPVFFMGFLIGVISFVVSDRIVPKTYRSAYDLKEMVVDSKKMNASKSTHKHLTYRSTSGQLYYFGSFNTATMEATNVIGLWLDPYDKNTRRKMMAAKGHFENEHWVFQDIVEHHIDSRGRVLGEPKTIAKKIYPEADFTPKQLTSASSESIFLNYKELRESIQKLEENGVHVRSEKVDLHSRLSSPWQALVMMLICVPFLGQTANRKLITYQLLLCVGLVFAFNVSSSIILAMGRAGKIYPFLGAWGGNIAFAVGGFFYLDRANY